MDIENIDDVVQEEVVQEEQLEEETPAPIAPKEDLQAKNIREMRLNKERAERERDEAFAQMRRLRDEIDQKNQQKPPVEEDEDLNFEVNADDLVEGKHLSKVAKKIKRLEDQIKTYQQNTTSATVETRIKQKYNDFDNVVSKDNVAALVRDYPELGETLRSTKDLYSQAVTAYTMIKQMGIYSEDKYSADRIRAEENASKPRPLASVSPQQGDSPLSRANAFAGGLTPELKQQLLKEMEEARSRM